MINGLLDFPVWGLVVTTLVSTHITIASVTIFLHRHQAHRALDLHPVVSHFFRFWLWMTTSMVTKQWVAVHRKHHAKCETPEDPHSPRFFGIRKVLWEGAELYGQEAANPETLQRYGYGTPEDWLERHLYSRFPNAGVALYLLLDLLFFGVHGITVWAVQMIWIPFWAAGVVNGLGHYWGYRNFETPDASTNLIPFGLLIGGEELHNNHHAYPASARLSNRWWEIDIGWAYIRLMQILGLAKVRRIAPKIRIVRELATIDLTTVQAVVRNRFHVLALYSRSVVLPVFRHEWKILAPADRPLLKQVKKLLLREDLTLDEAAYQALGQALNLSAALATVYRFKQELKQLWSQSSATYEARIQALKDWCRRAEETQIEALYEFAQQLRGYKLQPA
ncbi:DesA family fatty acid desaturase [Candidatus Methylocalor cossyra]|uniref:Stearoyl-CoA desaturase (Delta-9 desaturase) n=1 Tax=Candidatus Methylocalor cossyra TaxID=3108543 RepID=A0ABM9NKI1_9GAMM